MTGLSRHALWALLFLVACSGGDGVDPSLTQGTDGQGSLNGPQGDAVSEDVSVGGGDSVIACWEGIQLCEDNGVKTCVDGVWSEVVPCLEGACVNGICTDCVPDCSGGSCGPDGCGGSCGEPDCEGRVCGSDGCGGSCGFCDAGLACSDGACSCATQCAGKECGPDGCGGECGLCQGDFTCSDQGECLPAVYRAVLIQDHWTSGCSNYNSSGSDIDAVGLYSADGELISYFTEVIEEVGKDQCTNNYTDVNLAIGPPDNSNNPSDYMALQGGWIMGRFEGYVPITSGMTLVVHEAYSAEAYSLYLATNFDCAESDDPGLCSLLLTHDSQGSIEFEIP